MNVETLEDRCLLSTMLGVPAVRSVDWDDYSPKEASVRRSGDDHDKLGPAVRGWTPAITAHELVEKIRAFKQFWKADRGDDDGGKPSKPPVVAPPETPSSPPSTPPGNGRPQPQPTPSPAREIDPATPAGKPQAESRPTAAAPSSTPAVFTPASLTSPFLVAADLTRPALTSGGPSDPAGRPVLDDPAGLSLALVGGSPEEKAGLAGSGEAAEAGTILRVSPWEQRAQPEAQAAGADLEALAFVAFGDGVNGEGLAPLGAEELADLSLAGGFAEPGLLGRAFEQLTDWLNTDTVRSTLPWLTAVAVAALAGEVARRQLRPGRQKQLPLPPWPSGAGFPPVGCGEGATS